MFGVLRHFPPTIFQLSAQLAASKQSSVHIPLPPKEGVAAEGGEESSKTVEELWEIIRFVSLIFSVGYSCVYLAVLS